MKSILNLLCYLRVTLFNIVTNINLNVELHITSLVCNRATFLQKKNVYISSVKVVCKVCNGLWTVFKSVSIFPFN